MIYTSYFAKIKKMPKEIIPISIAGKSPSWYNGLEYKNLAPKYSFFKEWKENHDNDYYIKHYNSEVLDKLSVDEVLTELFLLIGNKDANIALICYEKPDDFCHRHLVSDWLNKNGYNCKELDI